MEIERRSAPTNAEELDERFPAEAATDMTTDLALQRVSG